MLHLWASIREGVLELAILAAEGRRLPCADNWEHVQRHRISALVIGQLGAGAGSVDRRNGSRMYVESEVLRSFPLGGTGHHDRALATENGAGDHRDAGWQQRPRALVCELLVVVELQLLPLASSVASLS